MPTEIRVVCPDEAATDTIARLTDAGIASDAIVLIADTGRERSFIVRLVVAIAVWSIVGAGVGAALGALIWVILGPEGQTGFIIQAVVWGIFGHLIAGLWAGYLLLADRTEEDLPHDRPDHTVTLIITCPDEATAKLAKSVLAKSRGG